MTRFRAEDKLKLTAEGRSIFAGLPRGSKTAALAEGFTRGIVGTVQEAARCTKILLEDGDEFRLDRAPHGGG